jgi:F-type H+-transporting ATPase subunit epsilon
MTEFPLKIVTPDGLVYDGMAQEVVVRTTSGDMGILAKHTNCVAPIGMGLATIVVEGTHKHAACMGGMVSVVDGTVTLVPITFEWADDIDIARAEASEERALAVLADPNAGEVEKKLAQSRLKRARVRKSVAK